ncbi:MAG: MBOAT family protein [Oligoflexia bacterium]|nr:MBOAT family protein [Oligoflexia bacterium]
MSFNSISFLLFFPITTLFYFLIPNVVRIPYLLLISCIFYMAFIPKFIFILFLVIIIDYSAGFFLEKTEGRNRFLILISSLLANIGILFYFKYFNFFQENLMQIAQLIGWNYSLTTLQVILPIGLSFHTFQSMSYTIDVYFKKAKAERNFIKYSTYVLFYPQLVAGPIERPNRLIPQLQEYIKFDADRVASGLRLMTWGFFKKIVVGDRMGALVDQVYAQSTNQSGLSYLVATTFFAFQIYADFSGYCDIGRGAAKVLGIEIMKNFESPYLSKSISEFWTRWHISLSSWFKDYLYIPLGGNRKSYARTVFNILVVFLVSGLWHGANWTFVLWGFLNFLFLFVQMSFGRIFNLPKLFSIVLTFFCIVLTWVAFRAESIEQALTIYSKIFSFDSFWNSDLGFAYSSKNLWNRGVLILVILITDFIRLPDLLTQANKPRSTLLRWLFYICMIVITAQVAFTTVRQKEFIYFQF